MELKEYIRAELDGLERGIKRTLDTLTQDEVKWQPASGCNSIGLIIFHTARSEDSFIQGRLKEKPELWETGKWYKKLNVAEKEAGAHYTVEQVDAFPVPKLADLLDYYAAVRAQTLDYLKTMTPASFDKKIKMPYFGEITLAGIFSLIVNHSSQHIGEISYLRGLQRGMDK
jgi:uncharacterized damage-inducible protein DinB